MPVRLGTKRHPRALGVRTAGAVLSTQPSARERTERREANTALGAQRKHLPFRRAIEDAVGVLDPVEADQPTHIADPEAPRETPRLDVARAHVEDFAGADEIV